MAERAGATITEVDGSHVIMISQPQAVADVILDAVAVRRLRGGGRDRRMTVETSPHASAVATSFGPVQQIDAGLLNVGYVDLGPADGPAVLLLHGWPYDIHSYVDVAPALSAAGYRAIVPYLRGYGSTRFRSDETVRNGEQAVLAVDVIAFLDALGIDRAIVAGFDWGARTACIVAALWPERCDGLVSVSGYLIGSQAAGKQPLPPEAEHQWWYQYYFATERGRAGYDKYRREFAKLIWRTASPQWNFDDATFDRSAASFDNPDHVADRDSQLSLAAGPGRRRSANTTSSRTGSPRGPSLTYPRSRSRATRTGPHIRTRVRTPRSSPARIHTGPSREASDTTSPRKLRTRFPTPFSKSALRNEPLPSSARTGAHTKPGSHPLAIVAILGPGRGRPLTHILCD